MDESGYSDPEIAELYELLNSWSDSDDFYLGRVMSASSVLDVGCGTGAILRRAREHGHTGRLVGLDPAEAMLDIGRRDRSDIEWIQGDLSTVHFTKEFDLVFMSGHTFQVFVTDAHLRHTLTAVRSAISNEGRFVFETRNPRVRAWEQWIPENASEIALPDGGIIWDEYSVEFPIQGDVVSFTSRATSPTFEGVKETRSTLRFLEVGPLNDFLREAGLSIEAQYGDWDRSPLTEASPEIITIARG